MTTLWAWCVRHGRADAADEIERVSGDNKFFVGGDNTYFNATEPVLTSALCRDAEPVQASANLVPNFRAVSANASSEDKHVHPVHRRGHHGDLLGNPRAELIDRFLRLRFVAREQFPHGRMHRVVAVVEGDADLAAGPPPGLQDAVGALGVGRHRLLGADVAARLQGADDVVVVRPVHRAHHDQVDPFARLSGEL